MASSTSRSGVPSPPRRHRWLRRLGIAGLSLVGLVLVLVLGTLAYLATPSGGERLRKLVLEKANAAIQGTLTVRALTLHGGHLALEGVELRDPDGAIVASVSGLEVRLRLTALVQRRIDLALVRLDGPKLHLRQAEGGSNLQRAIAERNPTPKPAKEGQKSSLGLLVESLEIVHGVIDVVQRSADASLHVHLDDLGAHGSAKLVGDALEAELEIAANVAAPFKGPLHLSFHAAGAGERRDARLGVELGTARLVAMAGGTSLEDVIGRLELSVPRSSMAGETMGPVHVLAIAKDGELQLPELLINLPGVRIEARGQGSKERLALSGKLVATDLRALSRTLGKLVGPEGLSMKGQGQLDFAIAGSVEHPSVKADGSFPLLAYRTRRVNGLALHLNVPDAKSPAGVKARVTASTLALAPAKEFRAVHVEVDGHGQELTLDAAVHGYAELTLRAQAVLSPDGHSATLNALSLRYPEAQWALDAPVQIESRAGLLAVSPLTLRSGPEAISARVLKRGTKLDASFELRSLDLARLPRAFVDPALALGGVLDLHISLRGTADDPRLKVALKGRRLRVKQSAPSELDVVAESGGDGRLGVRVDLGVEGRKSFIELETPFTLGQVLRNPPTPTALMAAELRLEADVRELPLKLLSEAGMSRHPLDGTLSARVHVTGAARSPRGEVSVQVRGFATQGVKPLDALVRLQLGDELHADVRAERGRESLFTAKARVRADPRRLQDPSRLAQTPLSLEANLGPLSLSELQAATQPTDVDPARAPPRVRGTLTGRFALSGTLRDLRVTLRMRVDGLGAESRPDGQVAVAFDYADAKETLDLMLRSQNGGALHVAATAHVDLSYPAVARTLRLETAPVSATLQAKAFDPAFLSNLSGEVEKLGGLVYAEARLSGTMRSPTVNGRLEWKDGLLSTPGNGEFTNVHLRANGNNDRIELEELTARSGSGTAKLSALATRAGGETFKLHAAADLNRFPVMSQGQVAAMLTVRSTADGNVSATDVTIRNLNIPEAHVVLPDVQRKDVQKLDEHPDVVLTVNGKPVRGTKTKAPAGASAETAVGAPGDARAGSPAPVRAGTLTILVNAPRNLWIQGNDINAEIGLSDGFRIEYAAEPRVFGDVNFLRGRLDVLGRRFDLERDSKVSFTGPAMRPGLDVTASYKNEIEQVTVNLKVQGEPSKLQLQPTSEPPLSETEIYTLLATGHTSLHHGTGKTSTSGEAASLVGSLAASQLKKTLSSKLPLDVLSIEAGDSGVAGTKLEAGTYVNDRFYVGFTGRIGADPTRGENSNEVGLEYQLSKRWSVNGSYGDARAGDASVNWRKEY